MQNGDRDARAGGNDEIASLTLAMTSSGRERCFFSVPVIICGQDAGDLSLQAEAASEAWRAAKQSRR